MSAADYVRAIVADLRARLAAAVFVVADQADVDLLDRLNLRPSLHVPHGELLGYVLGTGSDVVVLLAGTDPRIAAWLAIEVPHVEVRTLAIDSPLLALGGRLPTTLGEADRIREQWLSLAADHSRLADLARALRTASAPPDPATLREVRR